MSNRMNYVYVSKFSSKISIRKKKFLSPFNGCTFIIESKEGKVMSLRQVSKEGKVMSLRQVFNTGIVNN